MITLLDKKLGGVPVILDDEAPDDSIQIIKVSVKMDAATISTISKQHMDWRKANPALAVYLDEAMLRFRIEEEDELTRQLTRR